MNVTTLVAALITGLIGAGGSGFLVAWRKDSRQRPIDQAAADKARLEITQYIEQMAAGSVVRAKQELEAQEQRHLVELARKEEEYKIEIDRIEKSHGRKIAKLNRRIARLEALMRSSGLSVPPDEEN